VQAIESKQFARAITLLEVAVQRTPDDASLELAGLRHAPQRRAGEVHPLYQKALALDSRHLGAHEYIGEAYLALDNLRRPRSTSRGSTAVPLQLRAIPRPQEGRRVLRESGGKVKPTASN